MMNANQIALALEALGLADQDWGPDWSTYERLAAGWRGSVACPAEADLLAVVDAAEARQAAREEIARLEAEVTQRRIRDALLTQAGADWMAAQEAAIAAQRAVLAGA